MERVQDEIRAAMRAREGRDSCGGAAVGKSFRGASSPRIQRRSGDFCEGTDAVYLPKEEIDLTTSSPPRCRWLHIDRAARYGTAMDELVWPQDLTSW